jgi:hypothetical protein
MLNLKIKLNKTVSSYFIARREEECKILISVLDNITYQVLLQVVLFFYFIMHFSHIITYR